MLNLTRTWAVMAKEFVQLTRDRLTYAMILAMPIMQLLLFGYAVNDDPRHLPTAVLALDNGASRDRSCGRWRTPPIST